jgi:membrane protein implicated in regulation of membrane protease activity
MDTIFTLTVYHWLVLGLMLLGAEALGAAGFLLGAGIAALVIGVIVFIMPELSTGLQLVLFAVTAVAASYLYLQLFRQAQEDDGAPELNQRAGSLIGHRFELAEPLLDGNGRLQIGDTFWQVSCEEDLSPGTRVEVIAADAMHLRLARVA